LPLRFWEKHTVLSDDELGFVDLASPGTIENLRHNSAIELNVVDPFTRRGFRFKGARSVRIFGRARACGWKSPTFSCTRLNQLTVGDDGGERLIYRGSETRRVRA
jgi:hypothetical protein